MLDKQFLLVREKCFLRSSVNIGKWGGGGGGVDSLPNKGRYGCLASSKSRLGKIPPVNLIPRQKSVQEPNGQASFHEL